MKAKAPVTGDWECVVVGGGPAGLSAAIYMGRFRRRTLVLDDATGRWTYGQRNDNYLGFPAGVSARRLHQLGVRQAGRFGVVFRAATVERVRPLSRGRWLLATDAGPVRSRTLIWAAGVRDLWPEFRRARTLIGKQLFWCIVCDGWRTRGKRVVILGNEDSCARTALQFLTYTSELTFLADPAKSRLSSRARRRLEAEGIAVRKARIAGCHLQDGSLASVELEDGSCLSCDYLFSLLGSRPRVEPLRGLPLPLTGSGHIVVDDKNRTTLPTFFAAGDVDGKHSHQVVTAAHEGSMAAQAANQVLYPPRQKL